MIQDSLGDFQISNHLIHDFDKLNQVFYEEGYLFFRNVLDVNAVEEVKQDFLRVLQEQGVVKTGESEPVWTGAGLEQIDDNPLYALDSYQELLELESSRKLFEKIFGEPVFLYRNTDIRFALPNDERHLTPPHQDHFFIRQTNRFRTAWIPLMNINRDMGGLATAQRSHWLGLLDHVEHETAYSYIFRGRKQRGVPVEQVASAWLTADYRSGDLLIFHSLTIHRALPNRSDRVRLSLDARYQPISEPRTWQSEKTILELREYRRQVKGLTTAEGMSNEAFETLLIEMMKRGLEASKENIKSLREELNLNGRK
ncbi:MAG: phytanoyl-CoA dioxygenase family protein [Terriglobia bacterium]